SGRDGTEGRDQREQRPTPDDAGGHRWTSTGGPRGAGPSETEARSRSGDPARPAPARPMRETMPAPTSPEAVTIPPPTQSQKMVTPSPTSSLPLGVSRRAASAMGGFPPPAVRALRFDVSCAGN